MEFGSKYLYMYNLSDEESLSEGEYEQGVDNDKHCTLTKQAAGQAAELQDKKEKQETKKSAKKFRRADTNVVAVKFDQLIKPSNMHTGDAVSCTQCTAIMSHISKLHEAPQQDSQQMIWKCDFCGTMNAVDTLPSEVPSQSDVTYMVTPAPATAASSCSGKDESMIVFCIDISGSMSTIHEVGDQRVTRLQCVRTAVDNQLRDLAKDHPNRRAALVTFESEVYVVGDGNTKPVVVNDTRTLTNYDELVRLAQTAEMPDHISKTRAVLGRNVLSLRDRGSTALGPALLMAVTMASRAPGSKVVMCTDGQANLGLGQVSNNTTEESTAFYVRVAETAKQSGVTVSMLTLSGTDCRLVELGSVADITGGQVDIVDPTKLSAQFGSIIANPIIATHVVATFIVHNGLYIRNEAERISCLKKDVGNVTIDSEVTFEYGIRRAASEKVEDNNAKTETAADSAESSSVTAAKSGDADQAEGGSGLNTSEPAELPFQVQIRYNDLDGAVALRVLTQSQPVTKDREEAEKHMNLPVIGTNVAQGCSAMALEGKYTGSRVKAMIYSKMVARNTSDEDRSHFNANVRPLEQAILSRQRVEAQRCGKTLSSFADDDDNINAAGAAAGYGPRAARTRDWDDDVAQEVYAKKSYSSKKYMSSK